MSAVIEYQGHAVASAQTATDIRAHVQRIQEVMKAVMKQDVHYGTIPGTGKPTLYKAGSEVLLSTFRIAVEVSVEDLSANGEVHYRVKALGRHQTSGTVIGEGVGECSSLEEKYRWRKAVCPEEFEATPIDRRRDKWSMDKRSTPWQAYMTPQVRTEPADVANTILKMAKKRAQIDLTLTALAASDVFSQDLEDLPSEIRDAVGREDGQRNFASISDDQITVLEDLIKEVGADRAGFLKFCKVETIGQIEAKNYALAKGALEARRK